MKKINFLLLCSVLIAFISCNEGYPDLDDGMYAEFKTNKGNFIAELYYEATPMTVASFVSLAEGESTLAEEQYRNKPFYDGLVFHRVIEDFMIEGGDPQGTGAGGPGYMFPNEIVKTLTHDSKGILSMANSGPDTNGSQFFIILNETPTLDGMYTLFGKVVKGMDVVEAIAQVETGPNDRPVEDIVMQEVNIIRKGSDAGNFNAPEVLSQKLQEFKAKTDAQEREISGKLRAIKQRYEELKADAKELESGLQISFIEKGNGPKPSLGDTITVNYQGYLESGQIFDTNIEEVAEKAGIMNQQRQQMGGYAPMPVLYSPEAPMIPGFKEGFQQMKVGDRAVLYIPSHLGYGERGYSTLIPPNSDLIFEIEVVGIKE